MSLCRFALALAFAGTMFGCDKSGNHVRPADLGDGGPIGDLAIPDLAVADLSAADDLESGEDFAAPDDQAAPGDMVRTTATLTVNKTGAAAAFATVSGGGVDCGATCSITVAVGTQVTLTQAVTARKGAWFQQWSGGCTGSGGCVVTLNDDLTVSAEFDSVNYVFVTSTPTSAALGAITDDVQSVADNLCKTAASNAGLPGTKWAAWISTSASSGSGAKNAKDKLTGARGWIRPDGQPFADQIPGGIADAIFYPPRVDETGATIDSGEQVATGTLAGNLVGPNCTDWSSSSGSTQGGEAFAGSGGWSASYHFAGCSAVRFYCFGIDYSTQIIPPKMSGHVAFLSTPFTMTASSSRDTADAQCQTDANANPTRVPAGTYQALLALTTEAASVRFTPPAYTSTLPWVRPDGVEVVAQPADLFNTSPAIDTLILAPIDVTAAGTYGGRGTAWTGADDPNSVAAGGSNCGDWVSTGGANGVFAEDYISRLGFDPSFFNYNAQVANCTTAKPVYCLQVL
jgi:hypothetical protein